MKIHSNQTLSLPYLLLTIHCKPCQQEIKYFLLHFIVKQFLTREDCMAHHPPKEFFCLYSFYRSLFRMESLKSHYQLVSC